MNKEEKNQRLQSLKKYGSNSLSYLTIAPEIETFRGDWEGYIGFKTYFKTMVILGDPITSKQDLPIALQELKHHCKANHMHACFFLNTRTPLQTLLDEGYKGIFVGQEAVVDLTMFSTAGKQGWSIRSSVNYAKRNKMQVEEYDFKKKTSKEIEYEISKIAQDLCKIKKMQELTFAFGRVDFHDLDDARYFICTHQKKIVGFLIYYPIFGSQSYYLDLTRRSIDAPRGVIDFLIVTSFEQLKKEGVNKIYIGYSPIPYEKKYLIKSNFDTILFHLFKPFLTFFYPSKSEYFFKNKYATSWEPNYFFYYPKLSIRMLFALVHSVFPGGLCSILLNKIKFTLQK